MRPAMLDPARDLAGATPETLTRSRRLHGTTTTARPEPVIGDEPPVGERSAP